jgi:hypothetical protein
LAPGLMVVRWPVPPVAADSVVTVMDEDMLGVMDNIVGPVDEDRKAGVAIVATLLLTEPDVRRIVLVMVFPNVLTVVETGIRLVDVSSEAAELISSLILNPSTELTLGG